MESKVFKADHHGARWKETRASADDDGNRILVSEKLIRRDGVWVDVPVKGLIDDGAGVLPGLFRVYYEDVYLGGLDCGTGYCDRGTMADLVDKKFPLMEAKVENNGVGSLEKLVNDLSGLSHPKSARIVRRGKIMEISIFPDEGKPANAIGVSVLDKVGSYNVQISAPAFSRALRLAILQNLDPDSFLYKMISKRSFSHLNISKHAGYHFSFQLDFGAVLSGTLSTEDLEQIDHGVRNFLSSHGLNFGNKKSPTDKDPAPGEWVRQNIS